MSNSVAIYAISADPITNGHLNIIKRASKLFDRLILAIGDNSDKKYLFPKPQRVRMATIATHDIPNIEVKSFDGMLSDFAMEEQANIIVRGVRNGADFEFETTVHQVGLSQTDSLETVLIIADPSLSHISSSVVKGLVKSQGDVSGYVPLVVKSYLDRTINNREVIGVTGSIASGKSSFCDALTNHNSGKFFNADLDAMAHKILDGSDHAPQFIKSALKKVSERFPSASRYLGDDKDAIFMDRQALAKLVFGPDNIVAKRELEDIMREPISMMLRKEINSRQGVILVNTALLVECDLLDLCNNHVWLVEVPEDVQLERMQSVRGMSEEDALYRLAAQSATASKRELIEAKIKRDGYGKVNTVDGSLEFNDEYLSNLVVNAYWEIPNV